MRVHPFVLIRSGPPVSALCEFHHYSRGGAQFYFLGSIGYDVTSKGDRFAIITFEGDFQPPVTLVTNWTEELIR